MTLTFYFNLLPHLLQSSLIDYRHSRNLSNHIANLHPFYLSAVVIVSTHRQDLRRLTRTNDAASCSIRNVPQRGCATVVIREAMNLRTCLHFRQRYVLIYNPQDSSKRFTLYFSDRPVHSDTISTSLGAIQPYAKINSRRLIVQISTTCL